jgi:hypothetical protein
MALLVSGLVRLIQGGRRRGKHVARIDNKRYSTDLAETE